MQLKRTGYHYSEKTLDLLIYGLILLFSLVIWWPSRYFPYFWDSAGYVINTSQDILTKSPLNLASFHTNFAHPPLVTGLLALMWRLFGTTQLVSHLFMFPFLPIYLISTYILSRKYLSRFFSVVATSMIAFSPGVLAEYFNIYIDLPAAALTILAICLASWNKPIKGILAFSLAILSKLPAFTVIPIIFFSLKPKKRWLLIIPVVTVILWLIYHQLMTGWLLIEPIRNTHQPKTLNDLYQSIKYIGNIFFIRQGRWVWSGITVLGLSILGLKHHLSCKKLEPFYGIISTLILSLIFFIITNEFIERYALYFFPLFTILVCSIIQKVTKILTLPPTFVLIVILLLPLSQVLSWRGSTQQTSHYEMNPPTDFAIIDMIRIFRELSATIEAISPQAQIYGGFPEVQMLTQPIQGYVTKPLDFKLCKDFFYDPDVLQLLIVHPYAPSQFPCRALLDVVKVSTPQIFEKNGKWVELYQIVASSSAAPDKAVTP